MITATYPTLKVSALLARYRIHHAPSGGRLTARRWGHRFVVLDIDRYFGPFGDEAGAVMRPLADDLAFVAFWSRDCTTVISPFGSTGTLYAPLGAADALLVVLVAADRGDVEPAHRVAPVILDLVQPLRDEKGSVAAKKALARAIAQQIEAELAR